MLNYAEIAEQKGALIALDQEKAYDKIEHDYLWKVLEAFNIVNQLWELDTNGGLERNKRCEELSVVAR